MSLRIAVLACIVTLLVLASGAAPASAAQTCVSGDCANGVGKFVGKNGRTYTGKFQKSRFHGEGVQEFVDGDRYEGHYADGQRSGFGIYSWGSESRLGGQRYVGEWLKDGRHGLGTQYWPDGRVQRGYWKDDSFVKYSRVEKGSYRLHVSPALEEKVKASREQAEQGESPPALTIGVGAFRDLYSIRGIRYGSGYDYAEDVIAGLRRSGLPAEIRPANRLESMDNDYNVELKFDGSKERLHLVMAIWEDGRVLHKGSIPILRSAPSTQAKDATPSLYLVGTDPEDVADQSALAIRAGELAGWKVLALETER